MFLRNLRLLSKLKKTDLHIPNPLTKQFLNAQPIHQSFVSYKNFATIAARPNYTADDDELIETNDTPTINESTYLNKLKPSEIETLKKAVMGQTTSQLGAQDFNKLAQELVILDVTKVQSDHLYRVIKFIGGSVYRKVFFERACLLVKKYLNELKRRSDIQEILADPAGTFLTRKDKQNFLLAELPNIILSCSNVNLYDKEFFQSYEKFLAHNNGEFASQNLEVKSLLSLYWSYKRLNKSTPELDKTIIKALEVQEEKFTDVNYLRLLWMVSINHQDYPSDYINYLVKQLLEKKAKKYYYSYNPKNLAQILQLCFSLYPSLLKDTRYDSNTEKAVNRLIPYEEAVNDLKANNNPYLSHFEGMYHLFAKCWLLAMKNGSNEVSILKQPKQVVYVEQTNTGGSYFVFKPKLVQPDSVFEKNVVEALSLMKDIKFSTGHRFGMYEVDVIVNSDTILEINGQMHYLQDSEEFIMNYQFKLRHLKTMGFKKVANLFYQDWERTDNLPEKRIKLIRKALENAVDIK